MVYLPRNKNNEIDFVWQQKLADKVIRASRAKVDAQAKLNQAMKLVEDFIEETQNI